MRLRKLSGYAGLVPTGLALLLALPGCSGGDDDDASAAASPTPTATPAAGSFSSALGSSSSPSSSPSEDGGAGGSTDDSGGGDDNSRDVEEGDILVQQDNTLYILNAYRGLEIVDMTDPDKPRLQGHVAMTGYPVEMYVSNGRAYVVVSDYFTYWRVYDTAESPVSSFHGSALAVIDVKNPQAPSLLGKIDLEGYVNQTRQVGDVIYAVSTRYAYSSCGGSTDDTEDMTYVVSVDITDPSSLHTVGEPLSWPGTYAQIHATSDALYVVELDYSYTSTTGGDSGGGSTVPAGGSSDGSTTSTDGYQYTTDVTYVDISDPHGAMSIRGHATVQGYVYDKDALDEYDGTFRLVTQKYNGDTSGTLTVLDVSDPDHLTQLSTMDLVFPEAEYVTTTRFDGDKAVIVTSYNTSTMTFLDLSDPAAPRKAGQLDLSGYVYHLEAVDADQRLVALGQDTNAASGWVFAVSLFDMSDVDKPAELDKATIGDGDYSWSQATWDDKAFTLLPEEGLIALPFTAYSYVTVDGGGEGSSDGGAEPYYYYQSTGGVQLLDYSADALIRRGMVSYPGYITRVRPVGDRLVSLNDAHLLTINATDRDNPQVSADLVLTRNVTDYAPMGDYGVQLTLPTWADTNVSGAFRVVNDSDADSMDSALGSVDLSLSDGQLLTFANHRVGLIRTSYDASYNASSVLDVYDISKPSKPVQTAELKLPAPVWSWATDYGMYYGSSGGALVRSSDTLAYLQAIYNYNSGSTDGSPGSEPAEPPKARAPQDSVLSTLYVIDMSNPDKPALATLSFDQSLFGLRAEGSTLYATHAVSLDSTTARYYADVIDVSNPAAPVAQDPINVPGTVMHGLQGGNVLVTLDQQWTKDENGYSTLSYALRTVKLQNGRAYALDSEPLPGYAYSVVSSGNVAYVLSQNYTYYYPGPVATDGEASSSSGSGAASDAYYPCYYGSPMQLIAIDLTDPADLKTASTQDLPISYGYVRALAEGRLFVDGSYNGLLVYDVETDPLNPDYVDFAHISGWAYHVRIADHKAYLPAGMYGVSVFSF